MAKTRKREWMEVVASGALLLAWCLVIVAFSGKTGPESQGLSDGLIQFFLSLFNSGYETMSQVQQETTVGSFSYPVRKLAHFSEYFVLCGFAFNFLMRLCAPLPSLCAKSRGFKLMAPVAFSALYAATDEFHQMFVAGRSPQLFDVGVDTCGALAFALVALAIWALRERRRG